jgi:hypothetical protein
LVGKDLVAFPDIKGKVGLVLEAVLVAERD